MKNVRLRVLLGVKTGLVCGATASAGPLFPPAGPPESTDKPLTEVEPRIAINSVNTPGDADSRYRITQRGSYYLTRDLGISLVRHGIEIASDNVTIDLMGFTLFSADPLPIGSPPVSLDGIHGDLSGGTSFYNNITIRNGVIRGFGEDGIDIRGRNCRFENLQLYDNRGKGLETFSSSVVVNCQAFQSGGNGFEASSSTVFLNCTAEDNSGHGFDVGQFGSTIGCTADNNDGSGFVTSKGARVVDCAAFSQPIGFDMGSGSVITGCAAAFNSVGVNARVIGSEEGTIITECAVTASSIGYSVQDSCYLLNSIADNCTNAGIRVTGSGNRIEGNHAIGTFLEGFEVSGVGNLIVRNTANNNGTDYLIAVGNRYGPIVDISAGGALGVNGSSAAGTLGTTDPWANFSH
ncbi:MAG: right-handed parallel beta-helix repeat-containing protein [Planctomycetota bacterium]